MLRMTTLGCRCLFLILIMLASSACQSVQPPKVKLGIDVLLEEKFDLIKGKKIGLITNSTGLTGQAESDIDVLHRHPGVQLIALFGPEHGIRGDIPAGEKVAQYQDQRTGLPVYSLYGATRRPTPAMLKDVEILLYDIQDIGSRAYTYIYTMAYAMEAARDAGIRFVVLDRPNPLGGDRVEGNVLDPKFSSFIGLYPIPQVYGMTVGELAQYFNAEFKIRCDLVVVPMSGWSRTMSFEATGLLWTPTSPHIPRATTPLFEAATGCMGELDTISEGVGYPLPFELVGAPWLDGQKLAAELNARHLPGVYFRPLYFRPYYLKFVNQQCAGVQIHLIDPAQFLPAHTQVHILTALQKLYPQQAIFKTKRIDMFNKAFGTDQIQVAVERGDTAEQIIASWQPALTQFKANRQKYLIYR